MYVYRITHQKRASDLQGTGGLYTSGRWHRKGTRLLYTAQSIALSKIEVLANTSGKVPEQQVLITLEIRDDSSMLTLSAAALPNNWHCFPYPAELAGITKQWIQEGRYWIMRVPSAQSPREYNYLLNPQHPTHASLRLVNINPHEFDRRLKG